jgi:hypothetical protein
VASRRTQRTAAETPELVLEVAHELFYWRGIRVTGVDLVAAEAGIARRTPRVRRRSSQRVRALTRRGALADADSGFKLFRWNK